MDKRASVGSMKLALALAVMMDVLSGCNGGRDGTGANDPGFDVAPVRKACYQEISHNGAVTEKKCIAWWTNNRVWGNVWAEAWGQICNTAMGTVVSGCPAEDAVGRCTDTTSGVDTAFAQETVYYQPVYTLEQASSACSAVFTAL